jgi:Dynamin GTPase effector domain
MFVDNFLMQVVERHLLDDMSSLFKNVYTLSDDDIEDILKEREDRSRERESLVLKIKRLKEANNILNN